jgi:hypothetical protein
MQRTRRDSDFDRQVRRAMSRREDADRDSAAANDARLDDVREQMARWETEGGALGDRALIGRATPAR